ncbi:MAG: zf-HC2 domain-containing protein [Desulfovibrionaceae bacterium]|jgi:anti-sigma factor RsiW|nr:zf-HC2 domain-containing protein [Desulfovibrionaceae bacterium]
MDAEFLFDASQFSNDFCPGYNVISGYLDKNLAAKQRKMLEAHLSMCRECRMKLFDLRAILNEING